MPFTTLNNSLHQLLRAKSTRFDKQLASYLTRNQFFITSCVYIDGRGGVAFLLVGVVFRSVFLFLFAVRLIFFRFLIYWTRKRC